MAANVRAAFTPLQPAQLKRAGDFARRLLLDSEAG
jgi:hypothetical protein